MCSISPMPRRSDLRATVAEAGRQPGVPQVGRLDDVVVDADDLRERRGAPESGGGVVDQVGHGCSSVAAKGTSGANDSSSRPHGALVAGPDPQHDLGDAEPGVVLQLALVGDGPEGHDGQAGRVASGFGGQRVQTRDGGGQSAAADGDPAVGALDHGVEHRVVGAAADEGAHARAAARAWATTRSARSPRTRRGTRPGRRTRWPPWPPGARAPRRGDGPSRHRDPPLRCGSSRTRHRGSPDRPRGGRGWRPAWPGGWARAGRPAGCRCRARCGR